MQALNVSNLCYHIGDKPILDEISFGVEEKDKVGVIGVNGCGKSTLFRLLAGKIEATRGDIFLGKGKNIGYLSQDGAFDLQGNKTVLEEMYAAFPSRLSEERKLSELEKKLSSGDPRIIAEYTDLQEKFISAGGLEFRGRCRSILSKLGFDEDAIHSYAARLSGGQKTRLALAVQLIQEPDILLLDEPTNHLDLQTLSWLESYLISYPKCVMVVSHDRYFLDRVTNKTLLVEHHKAKLYNGSYTKSMEQRDTDREIAERQWKNQQKEIARQEAYIAQQRAWNRERNIIAAESRQKLLDKMEKLERPEKDAKGISMKFNEASASGNDVLDVRNLSMQFGERKLFENVNFSVKRGERVLIIGPNGCGKSTLIKLILKQLAPSKGVIEPGYHVEIGYYDQENQNLTPEKTVLDELWDAYPHLTQTEVRNTLGLFRFVGDDVFKTVSVLSGGERARLTLAKLMRSHVNFLVLDEPTNHLDIHFREALEDALSKFDGTVLTVSHDRYLIEKLATKIVELKPNAVFGQDALTFFVDRAGQAYTEFQEYVTARIAERQNITEKEKKDTPVSAPTSQKEQYLLNKQQAAEERKKKAQTERLKKECEELEAELSEIEAELFGSAASDYLRAAELDARKNEVETRLMEIYEILG